MNERIKLLAEQATQKFSRFGERDSWEKLFAELIVQECMSMCQARADNPAAQGSFRDGALLCQQDIKQHFGVE